MTQDIENLDINAVLDEMAAGLRPLLDAQSNPPIMIGIHTGGVWVAQALHERLGLESEMGSLNIHFYRDDFTRAGLHPQVRPSKLPVSIDERNILLVDDILHTGRTVRAAMNELFDFGRPTAVRLAVLIDRGGHELPVAADVTGRKIPLPETQHIKLHGPSPLSLKVTETGRKEP